MAKLDILSASKSYREKAKPEVLKRRQIVLSFLNDEYQFPRGKAKEALGAVKEARCPSATRASVGADAALYRLAYRFLTGSKKERQEIEERVKREKPTSDTAGIRNLLKDGFDTLDKVARALASETAPEHAETEHAEVTERDIEHTIPLTRTVLTRFVDEFERVKEENRVLRQQVEELEGELESLQARPVEELAEIFPEVKVLLELSDVGVEKEEKPPQKSEPTEIDIRDQLPKFCKPVQKRVKYSRTFIKALERQTTQQQAIVDSLELFVREGPGYRGLSQRKRFKQYASRRPVEVNIIRSGDFRLAYREDENGFLEFVLLTTRGDSRLYDSEGGR